MDHSGSTLASASVGSAASAPGFYEKIRRALGVSAAATNFSFLCPVIVPLGQGGYRCLLEGNKGRYPSCRSLHRCQSSARVSLKPAAPADRQTFDPQAESGAHRTASHAIWRLTSSLRDASPERLSQDWWIALPGVTHFGERWARHWMDVMRFAETFGNDWNYEIKGAWLLSRLPDPRLQSGCSLRPAHSRASCRRLASEAADQCHEEGINESVDWNIVPPFGEN